MVGDVLSMFLSENGLGTPLLEHRAMQSWLEAAGSTIAAQTTARFVREQAMWIAVRTPHPSLHNAPTTRVTPQRGRGQHHHLRPQILL